MREGDTSNPPLNFKLVHPDRLLRGGVNSPLKLIILHWHEYFWQQMSYSRSKLLKIFFLRRKALKIQKIVINFQDNKWIKNHEDPTNVVQKFHKLIVNLINTMKYWICRNLHNNVLEIEWYKENKSKVNTSHLNFQIFWSSFTDKSKLVILHQKFN